MNNEELNNQTIINNNIKEIINNFNNFDNLTKYLNKLSKDTKVNYYFTATAELINNKYGAVKKSKLSNNLLDFDQNIKNSILSRYNNVIIENKIQLEKYVKEALEDNSTNKNLHLGVIPNEVINRIKNEITDIKKEKINSLFKDNINYALAINQSEVRHLKKDSLSANDVVKFVGNLDELISNFDTVRYTVYNNNQNALRFKKKMQDGTYIALEVISNKNHTLRTHTLFLEQENFENKKRNIFPTLNESKNSLSKTLETDGLSIPSANNVPQSNKKVNTGTSIK